MPDAEMSKFDADYFFILKERDERLPFMTPDDATSRKPYTSERLPPHAGPLVFLNGAHEHQEHNGIGPMDTPPELLFHGSDILVTEALHTQLLSLEIPDLAMQSAVYIDHWQRRHENRWYLSFLKLFDCWDRDASSYRHRDFEPGEEATYKVRRYSLNDDLLEKTPISARRLFKMGGTTTGFVVVHASIAPHFRLSGAVLLPIAAYGMSY